MNIKGTKYWKRLKNILSSEKTDVDSLLLEIENLHLGRKTRNLGLKTLSFSSLITCSVQEMSYRSRVVEIVMSVTKSKTLLETAYEETVSHYIGRYNSEIPGRTKGDKDSYVRSFFRPVADRLSELSNVVDQGTYVIEDIDKTGWSLKLIMSALELKTKREHAL